MSSLIVLDKQPQSFQFSRLNAMIFFLQLAEGSFNG